MRKLIVDRQKFIEYCFSSLCDNVLEFELADVPSYLSYVQHRGYVAPHILIEGQSYKTDEDGDVWLSGEELIFN